MSKRFIITESERNQIRKMYGLIKEGKEQVQEIETYTLEYIDKDGCDGIAQDVKNLHQAVNSGQVVLSPSGKASLEENLGKVGMIGGWTCGIAKNKMKETLNQEINNESQYPDMIASACWMSKNSVRYTKSLSICNQPPVQNQNNNQNNDQNNNQTKDQNININQNDVDISTIRDYNQNTNSNLVTPSTNSELSGFRSSMGSPAQSGRKLSL